MNSLPPGFGPRDRTPPDRAHTDHTRTTSTLKEFGHGEPWVMIEEDKPGLPVLKAGDAFLGIQFRSEIPLLKQSDSFTR